MTDTILLSLPLGFAEGTVRMAVLLLTCVLTFGYCPKITSLNHRLLRCWCHLLHLCMAGFGCPEAFVILPRDSSLWSVSWDAPSRQLLKPLSDWPHLISCTRKWGAQKLTYLRTWLPTPALERVAYTSFLEKPVAVDNSPHRSLNKQEDGNTQAQAGFNYTFATLTLAISH